MEFVRSSLSDVKAKKRGVNGKANQQTVLSLGVIVGFVKVR
jgi:hypothetical protein